VRSASSEDWTDRTGKEAASADIWRMFETTYLSGEKLAYIDDQTVPHPRGRSMIATIRERGLERTIAGVGSGPVDAFVASLRQAGIADVSVVDYSEHALGAGADGRAAAYVALDLGDGRIVWGVGIDRDIVAASLHAVVSAAARG